MTKLVKVTISGSYRNAKKEIVDYNSVSGTMPKTDYDLVVMHSRRYVNKWIKEAENAQGEKLYPDRIEDVRQIFVEKVEDVEGKPSFIGKDVREMTYDELQDLASAKDLRKIPFPQNVSGTSLHEARIIAYAAYVEMKGGNVNHMEVGFNLSEQPPLIVDGKLRRDNSGKVTNDEIIDLEQKTMPVNSSPKSQLSLDDLKGIARQKNIPFTEGTTFDQLYGKLYGAGA